MANVIAAVGLLVITALFWVQRDYTTRFGGTFPDPVLIALGALNFALLVLGLTRWRNERLTQELSAGGLVRALGILVAWVAALPFLGYLLGGILFFWVTAVLLRTERLTVKGVLLDAAVALVTVGALYLVFTRVLVVRLPTAAF